MNKRGTYILLVLAFLGLVALFYLRFAPEEGKFDWRDSWVNNAYSETNDGPYGTLLMHRLLGAYFPDKRLRDITTNVTTDLPLDGGRPRSYLFIGEAMYLDSLDTERLLAFVAAGNTALLSTKTIPFDLMFHLYYQECTDAEWSDYEMKEDTFHAVSLKELALPNPVLLHFARRNKPVSYRWSYIESRFFCDSLPQRPLGYLDDSLINFAEFPYGQGRFLLHSTPVAFSNYSLLRSGPRAYAERVLSYLPRGDIYWDTSCRVPESVARRRNRTSGHSREVPEERPLAFVLKQPALAWAWYILVGSAVCYLIFRAKRRQRVLPVLAKNENSSYEFITTMANLHFRQQDYQNLCIQQMKLFLAQIRERYGLVVQINPVNRLPRIDSAFVERLAQVSERPEAQIKEIFSQYGAAVQYEPTEDMMIELHYAMTRFFKQAK